MVIGEPEIAVVVKSVSELIRYDSDAFDLGKTRLGVDFVITGGLYQQCFDLKFLQILRL